MTAFLYGVATGIVLAIAYHLWRTGQLRKAYTQVSADAAKAKADFETAKADLAIAKQRISSLTAGITASVSGDAKAL